MISHFSDMTAQAFQGSFALCDLLAAEVVLRTPKMNILGSLVESSNGRSKVKKESTENPASTQTSNELQKRLNSKSSGEVTLPLKDVLGLVTLVANLESHIEGTPLIDDSSLYSTIHSMISMEAKFPQLKEQFSNLKARTGIEECENEKSSANLKYLSVPSSDPRNHQRIQRRGSCLDAFLDQQIKHEYIEVVKEDEDTPETEEIEIDAEDDEDDTYNGMDIALDDEDEEDEDIENNEEDEDGLDDITFDTDCQSQEQVPLSNNKSNNKSSNQNV